MAGLDELYDDDDSQRQPLIARLPPQQDPVSVRGINVPSSTEPTAQPATDPAAPSISPRIPPSIPSPPAGSTADLESKAASVPTALGNSLRTQTQPAQPSPLQQKTAADWTRQAELSRGSGISQIKNPFARGALRGLNIAGELASAVIPQVRTALNYIPGTEEHHNRLVGQNEAALTEDQTQADKQAQSEEAAARTGEAQARTGLAEAQTDALKNPEAKPKEENWADFPNWTDTDGTPLLREQTSGQVVRADNKKPPTGFQAAKPPATREITRVVNGVPHTIMVYANNGNDIKDEGQTKIPGESPGDKRAAADQAQVERESRQNIRKAEGQYRDTQKSVSQLRSAIDASSDGNGLLTSFVPTMEVLGINAANGVHRISPQEAQAAQLPGGWAERFNAWFDKAATGKISPELKTEGKQLAGILVKSAHDRYQSTYDDENGIASGYGIKDFNKRVPFIPAEQEQGGGGAAATSEPQPPKAPDPGNKWQHRVNPTSGQTEWRQVPQ